MKATVVAIIAAYNEQDIIGQVVGHLVDEGLGVYLIDNHSTDRTVAEVERYRDRGVIGVESFPADGTAPDRFIWSDLLRRKEALARTLQADWILHHDADEFRESPWSGISLHDAIARVDAAGYNAIDFRLLNFWPTNGDLRDGEDVMEAFRFYEIGGVADRVQIKCWKNIGPVDLVTSGGHEATFEGRRVFPIRFLVRHYPIRGQHHGERKILKERIPRFDPAERSRGWHVQYDGVSAKTLFVRKPEDLIRYDADAVRLDLLLRHREVERLEDEIASEARARDALTPQLADLRAHLDRQDEELGRLRSTVRIQTTQLEEVRTDLALQNQEVERLRPLAVTQAAQLQEIRQHLSLQDDELARLRSMEHRQAHELNETRAHKERVDHRLAETQRELEQRLRDADAMRLKLAGTESELGGLRSALAHSEARVAELLTSRSWRWTAPLRALQKMLLGR